MRSYAWIVLAVASCGRVDFDPLPAGAPADARPIDAPGPPIVAMQGSANNGTNQTLDCAFPMNVGAHDALIVAYDYNDLVSIASITDDLGTTFETVVGPQDVGGYQHLVMLGEDVAGGADTIHIALSAAGQFTEVFVEDYANVSRTNAFDVGSIGLGTSLATDGLTAPTVTPAGPNEVVFAHSTGPGTATFGTGWDHLVDFDGNISEDRVLAAPAATTATSTIVDQSGTWILLVAVLRGT